MLTFETLEKIRRIEFRTRRLVDTSFAGAYHAVFKGRGIAFDSVRPYEPGDDVRDIDWNVTARIGEPYIKRYTEERELTVMLVLDTSASFEFGTVTREKRDIAAELGAVLAFSAITNNDKVGLLLFSDEIEKYIPPRKGRTHVLRLVRELLVSEPRRKGTDISNVLKTVNRVLQRRAIIFLISDFLVEPESYARDLLVLGRKHDLVSIVTHDPLEANFPNVGLVALRDAESDSLVWVDTTLRQWRRQFQGNAANHQEQLAEVLRRAKVDRIDLPVDGDYVKVLTQFFQQRARRIKA